MSFKHSVFVFVFFFFFFFLMCVCVWENILLSLQGIRYFFVVVVWFLFFFETGFLCIALAVLELTL